MFVRKEACPVWPEGASTGPGPGPCHGWAPGVAEGYGSFEKESFGSETVPRVPHYWVTTVSAWAVVWARFGCIRTCPRAVQCQGDRAQKCVCVCTCAFLFSPIRLWIYMLIRKGFRLEWRVLYSWLPVTNTLGRFERILPWYVCTYICVCIHESIGMCIPLYIYACSSA